jgi:chromosome segregation ATPase
VDVGTAVVSIASSGLMTAGISYAAGVFRRQRTAPVDNAERLSDAAMRQVDQFQERADRAEATADRAEAKLEQANTEVDRLRGTVRGLEDTVTRLTSTLTDLINHIHSPRMTIEQLRVMVPLNHGTNGTRL